MSFSSGEDLRGIASVVDEQLDEILDAEGWEPAQVPTPLLPYEVQREREKRGLRRALLALDELELVDEAMEIISNELPKAVGPEALERIREEADAMANNEDRVDSLIDSGEVAKDADNTFQTLLGISDETLSDFFDVGLEMIQQERWQEAEKVLRVLAYLSPYHEGIWTALGLALRGVGRKEEALIYLKQAVALNDQNIESNGWCLQLRVELSDGTWKEEQKAFEELLQTDLEALSRWKKKMKFWR